MAWSEYDPPNGNDVFQLTVLFKGGLAGLQGVLAQQGMDYPTDEQYQALVDAIKGSPLVQNAYITDTTPIVRTLTATPITPSGDE